jgi:hypothetical protein
MRLLEFGVLESRPSLVRAGYADKTVATGKLDGDSVVYWYPRF